MASAGKVMTIAGAAITAAFGLTVKAAIGFNKEVANIATLIPGSTKRVDELKSAIRDMAVKVGKDTTDLAEGAYQVISAFGDTADTVGILGIAATAATAGVADTADAINLSSAVTKGYGDTSEEAVQKASDLAFQTVTLGQTTFPELAASIGKVIPLTSELGVSQEELFAVMATGTGVTGKAAEVSTQLRGIMQSLMSPTADMTGLLEEQGYASGKAMLADKGLAGSLDVIKKAAEESGEPLQKYISSIEGQTLALALTGTQADNYVTKLAAMKDSVGLTDTAFKEQTEGVNTAGFAFKQAKIQISVFAQEIGDNLLPMLVPLIQGFTETIGKIREWVDANKPLVESIVKWGAKLGIALAVLGPIAVILPSLIAGVKLLSGAFIPFLVTGAIIAGFIKLNSLLDNMNEKVYAAQINLENLSVAEIETEMKNLEDEATHIMFLMGELGDHLTGTFTGGAAERKALEDSLDNLNMKMLLLAQRYEELTKAEEAGIDVTEEKAELDKEAAKIAAKIAEEQAKQETALKALTAEKELANAQTEIENRLYELTHTATENSIKKLEEARDAYIKLGGSVKLANKVFDLEIQKLKDVDKEIKDHIDIMEEVAKVTKSVEDAIFRLTHEPYEVKIKKINERYDDYIKVIKESTLKTKAQEKEIRKINIARDLEIEGVDKLTEAEKENIEQKKELAGAYDNIRNKILEIKDPRAAAIQALDDERQRLIDLGIELEIVDELYDLQIAKLGDVGTAFTKFGEIAWEALKLVSNYIVDNLTPAIENFFFGIEDYESDWKGFWEGLWKVLKTYISNMIAKLLIAIPLMLAWTVLTGGGLTWANFWKLWGNLGFDKGGGVGYEEGGAVKGFASGGSSTDTVPAMLTPGEYVIAKPMTDFIKRFKAIPQNLVGAIAGGLQTPTPAFAGGGSVGGISAGQNTYDQRSNYSTSVNIGAGAIVINTPKFSESDAQNMFRLIERQAKYRGLKFATN